MTLTFLIMISYSKYDPAGSFNYTLTGNDYQIQQKRNTAHRSLVGSNLNFQGDKKSPNPFDYTYRIEESKAGYQRELVTNYLGKRDTLYEGGQTGECYTLPNEPTADYARTLQGSLNKIYDQVRGNGGFLVDAAESRQTWDMLKNTMKLHKFVLNFFSEFVFAVPPTKRGLKTSTSGQRRMDYVSSKWLEERYGWTPLVHSIYTAADLIFNREIERIIEVKGRSGVKTSNTSFAGKGTWSDPYISTISRQSYRTELTLAFKLPPKGQLYDWTTLNPALFAFELLPYSFVADWVINISDVLRHFENYWIFKNKFIGGRQSNSQATDMYRVTFGATSREPYFWPNGALVPNQTLHQEQNWLERTRLRANRRMLLTELPYSNNLALKVNLGWKRQMDAAMMIHQVMKSHR